MFLPTYETAKGFTKSQCVVTNLTIVSEPSSSSSCSNLNEPWWGYWLGYSSFNGGSNPSGESNNLLYSPFNNDHSLEPRSLVVDQLQITSLLEQDQLEAYEAAAASSSSQGNSCFQVEWSVFFKETVEGGGQSDTSVIQSLWTNQRALANTWLTYYQLNSNHICFYDKNNISHASWTQLPPYLYVWTIPILCIGFFGAVLSAIVWVILKRKEKNLLLVDQQDIKHLYRDSQQSIDYRSREPLLIEHKQKQPKQQQQKNRSNSNGSNHGSSGSFGNKSNPNLPVYSFNNNLRYSKDLASEINIEINN
ncbi:hypothetical protein CYY_004631 [Polysphondylium violaceum]|uniref:Uncharacterized protein n=1 Tax=Polysphondylium violaceum TaxID=133409 RepID=A0A8J4PUV3_9MYCE|nr:hypothetical protein CYY_004631 [Polysphondylium violaceum]